MVKVKVLCRWLGRSIRQRLDADRETRVGLFVRLKASWDAQADVLYTRYFFHILSLGDSRIPSPGFLIFGESLFFVLNLKFPFSFFNKKKNKYPHLRNLSSKWFNWKSIKIRFFINFMCFLFSGIYGTHV